MFRNSFRRSLSQPLSRTVSATTLGPLPTTPFSPLAKLEFPGGVVCVSCQARALASKARRTHGSRQAGFLRTIKRLEAHVQHIEKRFADQVAKAAAGKKLPDDEITEEMKDQAYAGLMAPPSQPAAFLPRPAPVSESLPSTIVERLGSAVGLVDTSRPLWGSVIGQLEFNGGFRGMGVADVNGFILCMDLEGRVEHMPELWGMMDKVELEPNTFTYDLFMMAHAALKRTGEVRMLFQDLKERNVSPTIYTYAHLLKAFSFEGDFPSATRAFEEMHLARMEPNLVIYTTLIQTCIACRELSTAWQIFDLMKLKSAATAPDTRTYALMLHACAMEGESEKALGIYSDMVVRRGLEPTRETYHALIHSLAVRKDYYTEVWKYATAMQAEGFKMDRRVLGTLVQACAKNGDLTRARMLIRHMIGSGDKDLAPTSATYQCLFRAYATAKINQKMVYRENPEPEVPLPYVGPDPTLMKPGEDFKPEVIPFSGSPILRSHRDIMTEAKLVMKWISMVKPDLIDTQLTNAFLEIFVSQGGYRKLKIIYHRFYLDPRESDYLGTDNAPNQDPREQEPGVAKVPRNLWTFDIAFDCAYRSKDAEFAQVIWRNRSNYVRTKQYLLEPEDLRRRMDLAAHRWMIHILARYGLLGDASRWLVAASKKYKFTEEDVRILHIKALQLEDNQTLRVLKELVGDRLYRDYTFTGRSLPRLGEEYYESPDLSRMR